MSLSFVLDNKWAILGTIVVIVVIIAIIVSVVKFRSSHHQVVKGFGAECDRHDAVQNIKCPAEFPKAMGPYQNTYTSTISIASDNGKMACASDLLTASGKNKIYNRYSKYCGTPEATEAEMNAGGWVAN